MGTLYNSNVQEYVNESVKDIIIYADAVGKNQ